MAWKFGIYCLLGAFVLAAPLCKIFESGPIMGERKETDIQYRLYQHDFEFREV